MSNISTHELSPFLRARILVKKSKTMPLPLWFTLFLSAATLAVMASDLERDLPHPGLAYSGQERERTSFQTSKAWNPKFNLRSDVAIVYGIDTNLPGRIKTWQERGYRIHVMTGVAWGQYQDYLYGRFDGINHEDEAQTDGSGEKLSHGGDVYYMSPGTNYGRFLCVGIQRALDSGVSAIDLEEPEFWDRAGYSAGFKREWKDYYHEDWQPPDRSVDSRWRASKLKYFLYRRALEQVFFYIQDFNKQMGQQVGCYVATHSLLNYAQWGIVSPESSLAQLAGCGGYIAQVWTGTAREPNCYEGKVRSRTFETAFLEYGAMQNLVRSNHRSICFLTDPVEDSPDHSWTDYKENWESTMTAALLHPEVCKFEVAPWPERVFTGRYPSSSQLGKRELIPLSYATELQTVFNALKDMDQPKVTWEGSTTGIGVLVSDSLMFQRGDPAPSDARLGNVYGLAMPLLKRGLPVTPVQLENITQLHYLDGYRVLLLSYDGQKPLSPHVHSALAEWVKRGGALIFCDADADPYLKVQEWWNSDGEHYATPREHLFEKIGIAPPVQLNQFKAVGNGGLIWLHERPERYSASAAGAAQVVAAAKQAAQKIGLEWRERNYLMLRRGPYVVAAGLEESIANRPFILTGRFINLFDAQLGLLKKVTLNPGSRYLLIDLDALRTGKAHLLASACDAQLTVNQDKQINFTVEGIDQTQAILLLEAPREPKAITLNGKAVTQFEYSVPEKLLWIHFDNKAFPRELAVTF